MLPDLPQPELMELYRVMLTMRRFEEALILATKSGVSVGHFHVYIGQECTGAPALSLLRPDDTIFTTHRNHGHVLARGADPGRVLAEIMGRATGYNSGKGGTLHITARELGVLPTSAVVGGVVPLATGAAFAAKQKGSDAVCMCFFGDGVLEEGAFYEAINLGSQGNTPVAILTTSTGDGESVTFDAATVNVSTVRFEAAAPVNFSLEDVDGDGDTDLRLHFTTADLQLTPGSAAVTLTGLTMEGTAFEGHETVVVLAASPSKGPRPRS